MRILITLTLFMLTWHSAVQAQKSVSFGPQIALPLGVGLSGTARITPALGVTAEVNYAPLASFDYDGATGSYDTQLRWLNVNVAANYFPNPEKRFAFTGGLFLGGLNFSFDLQDSFQGNESADLWLGGPSLLLGLGWFGRGFNATLGGVFPASVRVSTDNAFIEQDIEAGDIEDFPQIALPYIRLGYQFGKK